MNAQAPGWHPDPAGRHQYRYWDGARWTDDVSDNGVASVDPVAGPAPAGAGAGSPGAADATQQLDPTQQIDATQQYGGQPYGGQPGGFSPQPGGYTPGFASGDQPPIAPSKSGPSTGLIVGLAALAVALIAGIAFVVVGGDDDTDTDDIASSDTTAPPDTTGEGPPTTGGGLGDLGGAGTDSIVEAIAAGIELEGDGLITHEDAVCAAQKIVDHFGLDGVIDMGASGGDPFAAASSEDQAALITAMTDCIPPDVLAQIGLADQAGG